MSPHHKKTTYLGFIFDSVKMVQSVTDDKKEKIQKSCNSYLEKESIKTRELFSLIGTLISTFVGNKLCPLCYWPLEKCKTRALKKVRYHRCIMEILNKGMISGPYIQILTVTAQKIKFSITDFFSKCE